ncbi:MAG: MBL fold metallo-hydrolase [Parcubacteria group bacterium CG10_big_fil_rev_8_21_14_0_10_38_31]|nr:MAG: MBL fold metallo-hydrolase [Parcubacteria group bacterium CG10_big_fil_rev_8_21_14_0_10_38_31]
MRNLKKDFKYYFLGVLLVATFFVWYGVYAETRSTLMVAFLDIGQGDAIFIETPNGNQVLIDGGRNKKVLEELGKIIPFYDKSIDVLIATHPDADHIGGLPEVIKNFDISLVMEPGASSDTNIYKEFRRVISEKNIQTIQARQGMKINLDENAYLEILFPNQDVDGWDTNDASIVARLIYGENSFLFTADSPQKIENYLASVYQDNLKTDILKVGHHGSKTSSSETFLGYTNPDYAIISAGRDNTYGHPHQEVMKRLEDFGIPTLRTDELGTIRIQSDGNKLYIK